MKFIRKCDAWIERITVCVCAALFAVIILVIATGVLFRSVLNNPLMWTEEVTRFVSIWLVFLGSSITIREDGHTSIDMFETFFMKTPCAITIHFVITRAICMIALIVFIPSSIDLIEKMGTTLSAATRLPMRYVYLAFTVGAVLMIIAFLKLIPTKGKEILNGISSEAELEDGGEKKQIEKEGENQ